MTAAPPAHPTRAVACNVHDRRTRRLRDANALRAAVLAFCVTGCATTHQPEDPEAPAPERTTPPAPTTEPGTPQPANVGEPAAPEEPAVETPAPVDPERIFAKRRSPCDMPEDPSVSIVGDMQEVMTETTCSAALWMDGLFGQERNLDVARSTHGFFEASSVYSQYDGWQPKVRFRVRFDLPNLQKHVSAVIGRDDEEEFRRDRTERFAVRSQFPGLESNNAWLAGLGYSFPGTDRFKTDFRVGVSGTRHPKLFAQQPTRFTIYSDENDLFYLRGTPFYNTDDGFGFTAGADYDRVLTRFLMLRLSEAGTISQDTEGVDWRSSVILYHNLREERALAYELLIRGETDAEVVLQEYGGRVVYRHPLLPRKLYGEFLVGYTWPRLEQEESRKGSAEVGLSLEVPFGIGAQNTTR